MATKKVIVPNVVRGGIAIPLKSKTNYYYMSGRSHEEGGIDIGKNPRTGLNVQGGELVHTTKDSIEVFSDEPFGDPPFNGRSSARRVLGGENPTKVFNQQEEFKKRHGLNDDGTKKRMGGLSRSKDYGSKSKPYPNVKSKDFAGGNRSYPIPTKADAIDALRLAGLHGRDDVKANVYSKYPELRKKAKTGGVYSVTVNGETKLKRFPSTGSRTKAALGKLDDNVPEYLRLNRDPSDVWRKHLDGSIWKDNTHKVKVTPTSPVDLLSPDAPKESFSPLRSNVPKEHYVDPGVLEVFGNSPLNTLAKYHHIPTYIPTSRWNNFSNKAKEYIKEHPETVSDAIGLASNTIGGLISHNINRRMLNKLDYFPQPIARSAAKLKTRININPQLDKMRESLAAYENDINNSTSSSNVALARRQRARFANTLQTNNIYANRENTETELINKDRLNQQSVADANVRDYNTWLQNQTTFRNSLLEKKAENDIGLIETINSGIQNMLTNREKRNTEKQNIAAMSLANPDLPVEVLYEQGLISKRVLDAYRKAYRARKKENNENNNV